MSYPLVLREGVDAVVIGEGENTFQELVKALKERGSIRNVKGIAYVEKGDVKVSYREPIVNLDELPMPAYDLVDSKTYRATILGENARIAFCGDFKGMPLQL
ncbi:MAG: anaerobic magnesium-protoporphyrin monomethyl ester cyclase [Thermococcaceae archaeon]|nr:anaerobic magnesium-protoporphyrin monomethyl ester cyclase [Thermococcaceae archaeon]